MRCLVNMTFENVFFSFSYYYLQMSKLTIFHVNAVQANLFNSNAISLWTNFILLLLLWAMNSRSIVDIREKKEDPMEPTIIIFSVNDNVQHTTNRRKKRTEYEKHTRELIRTSSGKRAFGNSITRKLIIFMLPPHLFIFFCFFSSPSTCRWKAWEQRTIEKKTQLRKEEKKLTHICSCYDDHNGKEIERKWHTQYIYKVYTRGRLNTYGCCCCCSWFIFGSEASFKQYRHTNTFIYIVHWWNGNVFNSHIHIHKHL